MTETEKILNGLSPNKFDEAAEKAGEELEGLDQDTVQKVAEWWRKWYMSAGHKRLGRILISKP